MHSQFEIVMGLETHVRVASRTKLFCSCENQLELADEPNIRVCPVCMGMPGALPVLSKWVVDLSLKASHALRMEIHQVSRFDRKSYSYPDLPSGYQITQLYEPIATNGEVRTMIDGEIKTFRVNRLHIEADAGKLVHTGWLTLCDYNRSGAPLVEIVTEPDFRSKAEVIAYLEELQKLMRWCGASDADMDKGQLRCDVNISIRPHGDTNLYSRVELKNINSFSAIGRAIDVEFARQIKITANGGTIDQETRGWDDEKWVSHSMRSKENAMDYRYFPEPDLLPLVLTNEEIDGTKIMWLPIDRRLKYLEYGLLTDDARILSDRKELSDFYDALVSMTNDPKKSASLITTVLFALMSEHHDSGDFANLKFQPRDLARLYELLKDNAISSTNSKKVVEVLYLEGGDVDDIVARYSLGQNNDGDALQAIAQSVIASHPDQVSELKSGNMKLLGFLVGQCMKASSGSGNPKLFSEILQKELML